MKKHLLLFPELFFAALAIYWAYENFTASSSVNYIALVVVVVMLFQMVFGKRVLGLIMGAMLTMFSFYMMLAVVSEYRDFPEGDPAGTRFLFTALGFFLLSVLTGLGMLLKYGQQKSTPAVPRTRITA
ncbi:hypothetical protein ACLI1A_06345 [Flavobacterium sp. RHBU_3]|uniref:hypothetical protein n=1 Tax=Flavobacterium sp. RHBU_3 TaxID=3391184 RepID=UPI003984B67C